MMKTSIKARYETDKAVAAATVVVNAGELKLRASMTDTAFINGPSINGLALAVEKPGFFIIDYNVPKKDLRFQFMNTVRVAEKPLNLTYINSQGDGRTILDGSLVFDSANKVSLNHVVGTGNTKFKYTYLHGGMTTFEPTYDLGKNTWDFAVSRRGYGGDLFKATYQTSSKNLGLEWSQSSKMNSSLKITAAINLSEERKMPRICAETSWDFEMHQ